MSQSPRPDRSLLFDAESHTVDRPIIRLFDRYAREYRLLILIGACAALLSPIATLLPIYLVETVIDGILLDRGAVTLPLLPAALVPVDPFAQLLLVASLMVTFALIGAGSAWVGTWTWGRFA